MVGNRYAVFFFVPFAHESSILFCLCFHALCTPHMPFMTFILFMFLMFSISFVHRIDRIKQNQPLLFTLTVRILLRVTEPTQQRMCHSYKEVTKWLPENQHGTLLITTNLALRISQRIHALA